MLKLTAMCPFFRETMKPIFRFYFELLYHNTIQLTFFESVNDVRPL